MAYLFWRSIWQYLTFFLAYTLTFYLSDILSGIYSDILSDSGIYSDIFSVILSDRLSGVLSNIIYLSGIFSGILSDICSDIPSDMLFGICIWHIFWLSFRQVGDTSSLKDFLKLNRPALQDLDPDAPSTPRFGRDPNLQYLPRLCDESEIEIHVEPSHKVGEWAQWCHFNHWKHIPRCRSSGGVGVWEKIII